MREPIEYVLHDITTLARTTPLRYGSHDVITIWLARRHHDMARTTASRHGSHDGITTFTQGLGCSGNSPFAKSTCRRLEERDIKYLISNI